jgi:hypothetical protein
MRGRICSRCGGSVVFSEAGLVWEFEPRPDQSLAGEFEKIRRKEIPKAVPADPDF